jgi:hypothetical protein
VAEVVFVHGIGQEQAGPATLDQRWRTALADGVWKAGHADLASRLRRPAELPGAVSTGMAFYADLFDPPGQQGGAADLSGLDAAGRQAVEGLAGVLLDRAAVAAGTEADRQTALDERAWLDGSVGEVQGVGNMARSAVAALTRLRWFAPFGVAVARRFVVRSLVQVVRYLSEPDLREQVQQRVTDAMGDGRAGREATRVLVGHSLGSVVAFEAAARSGSTAGIPLLLTLGSPLGIRTVVYDRLQPQPVRFPARVGRWVNVAADDDIVAAVPDLTALFAANLPPGAVFENRSVDNGSAPHDATHYLTKAAVGAPVAAALQTGEGR